MSVTTALFMKKTVYMVSESAPKKIVLSNELLVRVWFLCPSHLPLQSCFQDVSESFYLGSNEPSRF
jgi:hypothetical protein